MCCSWAAENPHPSLPSFCTTQHKLYRIQNCSDGDMFSHVSLYLIRGSCLRLNLGRFNYNLSDHFVCTSNLSCTPSVCIGELSFGLVRPNIMWLFFCLKNSENDFACFILNTCLRFQSLALFCTEKYFTFTWMCENKICCWTTTLFQPLNCNHPRTRPYEGFQQFR